MTVIQLHNPQPHEAVLEEKQIIELQPKYIRHSLVCKYIGCSKPTANRIIAAAEESKEFSDISISVSSGVKLIKIKRLDEYLESINSKWK